MGEVELRGEFHPKTMSGFPADFSDDPPDMSPEDEALAKKAAYIAHKIKTGQPLTPEDRLIYRRAADKGLSYPAEPPSSSDA